jgi:hypothetical protein
VRAVRNRGGGLLDGIGHSRASPCVVVLMTLDGGIERHEPFEVAVDRPERVVAGAPRLARVIPVPTTRVGGARDRVADRSDARRHWRPGGSFRRCAARDDTADRQQDQPPPALMTNDDDPRHSPSRSRDLSGYHRTLRESGP